MAQTRPSPTLSRGFTRLGRFLAPYALAGRDQSQTTLQMLTAPGERRIVGNGEVETHDPEQRVQEPFGLAQREMVDEPQGQGGLDGEIRGAPLPTPPAAPAGRPGSDRFRGQPHRHIAAANEGLVIGRPVRNAVLRLIRGVNLRLHPCSVAPAEARRAGQTAPPTEGLCRVALGDCSPEALTRTGLGGFHHPALPLMWLMAMRPRFARESEARAEDIVPTTQRTSARGPLPFEFLVT